MSENVRLITTARAMSTGDLAAAMGIARTSVVSKMFGRVRWNLDDLERAAAALDVEPAMLVSSLALSVVTEQTRDAASATPLVSVRPKGLEPPTFWSGVSQHFARISRRHLTCTSSGSAHSHEGWGLCA